MYYRKQIWVQARRSMHEQSDIHARLMSKYPQVPDWWYAIIFGNSVTFSLVRWTLTPSITVSMFVFGIVCIEVWHVQMPVWAFILALVCIFVLSSMSGRRYRRRC